MRLLRQFLLTIAGLCAFLFVLSGIAYSQITNSAQMLSGFNQFADTSLKGVSASAYPDYADVITGYLTGQRNGLTVVAADGTERPGFSEKETRHMADVRGLVRSLSLFRYLTGGTAHVIPALFLCLERGKESREALLRDMLKGAAIGSYILLGVILALAVWGAVNFTGLFVTFHKALFRNNLWLLNPREDLLIMLMPTSFFVWYAGQIALACLPVLAVMLLVPVGYLKIYYKQEY